MKTGEEAGPWPVFLQRTLQAASTSASALVDNVRSQCDGIARPSSRFASINDSEAPKKGRNKKPLAAQPVKETTAAPKDPKEVFMKKFNRLSPKQRNRFIAKLIIPKLKKRRLRIDGKKTNLYKMAEEILRKRKIEEVGGNEPQIRRQCRAAVTDSIPGEKLWPGAFKMQLRAAEEEALPLDLFARGSHFRPHPIIGHLLGGRRDFAFGIYGRSDEARRLLQDKWAGLPRDDVIFNQDFYEDVLNHAHELELTLMVMPVRPLPLRPLREAFVERLEAGLRHARGKPKMIVAEAPEDPEQETNELQKLQLSLTEKSLARTGLLDGKGRLLPDAHWILSARPEGDLVLDMITPGRLKDRKGFRAGPWKGSGLARAALGTLLGPYTFNLQAKVQAGQAIAYVTNGFKFKYDPTNENQVFSSWDDKPEFPVPEGELIPASSDLFTYEGRSGPSALVNNIQRKRDYRAAVAKLQSS